VAPQPTMGKVAPPPRKKMKPQDRPKKQPWFYAVRKGREVGVFKGWEETKGKIIGFSGAIVKPFKVESKARKWLERDVSQIDSRQLPTPKWELRDKPVKPSTYVLDFGTVINTATAESKGSIGMGWVLRKFPERTLVVAGCDLYDMRQWRKEHPIVKGYTPRLPRELPMLQALERGLDEAKRVFDVDAKRQEGQNPLQMKLPFPLYIRCDHVYTSGLLSGANPTIPDLVEPLTRVKDKISNLAAAHGVLEVPGRVTDLAQGLAKAAITRKNPKCTIEGGEFIPSYEKFLSLLARVPDVPAGATPLPSPPSKPLEVNGSPVA